MNLGISPFIVEPIFDRLRYSERFRHLIFKLSGKLDVYDMDLLMGAPALIGALIIPVVLTALAILFLVLSTENRATRYKIIALPSLFFGTLLLGAATWYDPLIGVGVILLAAAPNWLGEILRVRASDFGYKNLALFFLAHHAFAALTVLVIWLGLLELEKTLGYVWWGSFILGLLCFGYLLRQHPPKTEGDLGARMV